MVSSLPEGSARLLKDGRFGLGKVANLDREMARGNSNLIWGWKRDVGLASRMVYFAGELAVAGGEVVLARWHLFYRHRANSRAIEQIESLLSSNDALRPFVTKLLVHRLPGREWDLRLELGRPTEADSDRIRRLQLRKPRRHVPERVMPAPVPIGRLSLAAPADIYVGSGLSYEAGLPTLCDMHLAFGVDNADCTRFAVGEEDLLPARLANALPNAIAAFCAVHVGALKASPTRAMRAIAKLRERGWIGKVFTDNVDNMLNKVDVPFERTRGSGVFNELYPAQFQSTCLIVIGVAADRRSIVKQARRMGLQIIVVNPCEKVAPMVRHLDYVRPSDLFFRVSADTFFGELLAQDGGSLHQAAE